MYTTFYGLREKPFSLLPDPEYLYLSKQHRMALDLLEYSLLNQAGFCVITGEIGAGKTTLIRRLLNLVDDRVTIGLLRNVGNDYSELLRWILMSFGLNYSNKTKVEMHEIFTDFIIRQYAQNRRTVLIVDEAQHMKAEALEELRMLSNINADKDQVVQVILAGQKELRDTLRRSDLAQFAQRIVVDYHLGPLSQEDTRGYIHHRIQIAGGRPGIFGDDACADVFQFSEGIPRLINLLCDMALVYGYAEGSRTISRKQVQDVVRERNHGDLLPTFRWLAAAATNRQSKLEQHPAIPAPPRAPHYPERRKHWAVQSAAALNLDTAVEKPDLMASAAQHTTTINEASVEVAEPDDTVEPTVTETIDSEALSAESTIEEPSTTSDIEPDDDGIETIEITDTPAQTATKTRATPAIETSSASLFSALDAALTAKTDPGFTAPRRPAADRIPMSTTPRTRAPRPEQRSDTGQRKAQLALGAGILILVTAFFATQGDDTEKSAQTAVRETPQKVIGVATRTETLTAPATPPQQTDDAQRLADQTAQARQRAAEARASQQAAEQEAARQAAARKAAEEESARQTRLAEQQREEQAKALAAQQAAEMEAARQANALAAERERQAQALAAQKAAEAEAARQAKAAAAERERRAKALAAKKAAEAKARQQAAAAERERQRTAKLLAEKQAAEREATRQAQAAARERERQAALQVETQNEIARNETAPELIIDAPPAATETNTELSFSANPCKGVTARYLSTCK